MVYFHKCVSLPSDVFLVLMRSYTCFCSPCQPTFSFIFSCEQFLITVKLTAPSLHIHKSSSPCMKRTWSMDTGLTTLLTIYRLHTHHSHMIDREQITQPARRVQTIRSNKQPNEQPTHPALSHRPQTPTIPPQNHPTLSTGPSAPPPLSVHLNPLTTPIFLAATPAAWETAATEAGSSRGRRPS